MGRSWEYVWYVKMYIRKNELQYVHHHIGGAFFDMICKYTFIDIHYLNNKIRQCIGQNHLSNMMGVDSIATKGAIYCTTKI